jgi:virginiamycin B lyase
MQFRPRLAPSLLLAISAACTLARPLGAVQFSQLGSTAPLIYGVATDRFNSIWYTSGGSIGHVGAGVASIVTPGSLLREIATGTDGSKWVTEPSTDHIYRCFVASCQTYTLPPGSQPTGITVGPDGLAWFTEFGGNKIGRIKADDTIEEFPLQTPVAQPNAIITGPNGLVYFTEFNGNKLGIATSKAGVIEERSLLTAGAFPEGLASNGRFIVFTETGVNAIGMYDTTTGNFFVDVPIPTANSAPQQIVLGGDDAFWFTEYVSNKIGRYQIGAQPPITEYTIPVGASHPYGMAVARDGSIFFAETASSKLARLALSVPGDTNGDGHVDVADVFYLINFLFAGGAPPK